VVLPQLALINTPEMSVPLICVGQSSQATPVRAATELDGKGLLRTFGRDVGLSFSFTPPVSCEGFTFQGHLLTVKWAQGLSSCSLCGWPGGR
jgi:hypothetical protein